MKINEKRDHSIQDIGIICAEDEYGKHKSIKIGIAQLDMCYNYGFERQ